MAATVEIDEANGAGETLSHNVANWNFGANDEKEVVPATYPIVAGQNSYTKYWKLHVTAMGGSNKIDNLQVWKSAGAYVTGEGIQCSLRTSSYAAPTYATPTQSTYTDQAMPTADPAAANYGIGGSLSGSLTGAGSSDYLKAQLQTTGSTPPGNVNQKTFTIQYDEQ
jgi:hypothetical protein